MSSEFAYENAGLVMKCYQNVIHEWTVTIALKLVEPTRKTNLFSDLSESHNLHYKFSTCSNY